MQKCLITILVTIFFLGCGSRAKKEVQTESEEFYQESTETDDEPIQEEQRWTEQEQGKSEQEERLEQEWADQEERDRQERERQEREEQAFEELRIIESLGIEYKNILQLMNGPDVSLEEIENSLRSFSIKIDAEAYQMTSPPAKFALGELKKKINRDLEAIEDAKVIKSLQEEYENILGGMDIDEMKQSLNSLKINIDFAKKYQIKTREAQEPLHKLKDLVNKTLHELDEAKVIEQFYKKYSDIVDLMRQTKSLAENGKEDGIKTAIGYLPEIKASLRELLKKMEINSYEVTSGKGREAMRGLENKINKDIDMVCDAEIFLPLVLKLVIIMTNAREGGYYSIDGLIRDLEYLKSEVDKAKYNVYSKEAENGLYQFSDFIWNVIQDLKSGKGMSSRCGATGFEVVLVVLLIMALKQFRGQKAAK